MNEQTRLHTTKSDTIDLPKQVKDLITMVDENKQIIYQVQVSKGKYDCCDVGEYLVVDYTDKGEPCYVEIIAKNIYPRKDRVGANTENVEYTYHFTLQVLLDISVDFYKPIYLVEGLIK